jgi:hypothetical protein
MQKLCIIHTRSPHFVHCLHITITEYAHVYDQLPAPLCASCQNSNDCEEQAHCKEYTAQNHSVLGEKGGEYSKYNTHNRNAQVEFKHIVTFFLRNSFPDFSQVLQMNSNFTPVNHVVQFVGPEIVCITRNLNWNRQRVCP